MTAAYTPGGSASATEFLSGLIPVLTSKLALGLLKKGDVPLHASEDFDRAIFGMCFRISRKKYATYTVPSLHRSLSVKGLGTSANSKS